MEEEGMMMMRGKKKKGGLISKTWERCKSIGLGRGRSVISISRSKSWPTQHAHTPQGCFSVYVGPQMQRFVIKTEYANHPLFKMLLEQAESEYGYNSHGPLSLPCDVHLFYDVLMEIHSQLTPQRPQYCPTFLNRSPSAYRLLTPSPVLPLNHFSS